MPCGVSIGKLRACIKLHRTACSGPIRSRGSKPPQPQPTCSSLLTCSLSTARPSRAGVQSGAISSTRRYASSAVPVLPSFRLHAAMPSRTSGGAMGHDRSAAL